MYYFYWTSTTIRNLGEKAGSLFMNMMHRLTRKNCMGEFETSPHK